MLEERPPDLPAGKGLLLPLALRVLKEFEALEGDHQKGNKERESSEKAAVVAGT